MIAGALAAAGLIVARAARRPTGPDPPPSRATGPDPPPSRATGPDPPPSRATALSGLPPTFGPPGEPVL